MTSVLVTGAGGYIGQRLTVQLARAGHVVRAQVRRSLSWPDGVEQVIGDLVADPELARHLARDMDLVVHLAGANEVTMATQPDRSYAETVLAAQRVADSGIERAIYLSTVHVYGDSLRPGATVDETASALPHHPYAAARLACEGVFGQRGTPALSFRMTNGVGAPRQPDIDRWSLVANELCREGAVAGRLTLRTSGVQWRDFIALRDVEATVVDVAGRSSMPTGIVNLGSGSSVTILELATVVQDSFEALGATRPTLVAPSPEGERPAAYHLDITALTRLGLRPQTTLRQAVDETVRFCLDHRTSLA